MSPIKIHVDPNSFLDLQQMHDQQWRSWGSLIDSKVDTSSRWHSQNVNLVQTSDRIGDFLIAQLKTSCRNSKNEDILAEWARDLREKLAEYEQESRQLLRLASTGRVIRELEHGIKTTLDLVGNSDFSIQEWTLKLQREREERVEMYRSLLQNKQQLQVEMGDADQQLAVLTLMKNDVEIFGDFLTPLELDLIDEVYDTLVCNADIVVNSIPSWFETDKRRWSRSDETFVDGEEACLRHVETWGKLHHPHVRKFYGACHVGRPFIIHELTVERYMYAAENPWFHLFGCALGLKYVHERGLAHTKLSLDHLQSLYEFKGVLSGLNLTRIGCEISGEADVLAFGLVIYEFLVDILSREDLELEQFQRDRRLPEHRPSFFNEKQWALLLEMCIDDPSQRLSMIDVTHRLETIHSESNQDIWSDEEDVSPAPQTVDDIDEYLIPNEGLSISDVLQDADGLCTQLEDFLDINRPVYSRLVDVYQQFVSTEVPLPLTLVEDFSLILWRFFLRLEARSQGDWSAVATLCAANTIANRNYSLHYDIDRLILSSDHLQTNAVHHWQPNWKQTLQWRQEALENCVDNTEELLCSEKDENRRAEAAALLQYEAKTANGPQWLIPPHQIELGQHLADGSFGAVYLGKWFNTDVVVKQVLTNQSDRENREQFFHEVNLWASLNHDNLIKLYGACHLGQPFFVCEKANEGTLISYIQDRGQFPAWRAIWEAAKGLEHLHQRGIVHGDLKGNNILVCDATAKLADFGLSVFAESSTSEEDVGSLGAFRWKAPECLTGSGPTFASDIYSFAMCIIEAIGGDFPWGKSMDDSAVVFNVTNKRMIPPRPNGFSDPQWELVVRMCSFEPQDRPNATALVHLLWEFA